MYAIKQIKICAEYRDMLPRPRLVCQEPGLRPLGRSPGVPDKSSRGLGSMSRYSAQILICIANTAHRKIYALGSSLVMGQYWPITPTFFWVTSLALLALALIVPETAKQFWRLWVDNSYESRAAYKLNFKGILPKGPYLFAGYPRNIITTKQSSVHILWDIRGYHRGCHYLYIISCKLVITIYAILIP